MELLSLQDEKDRRKALLALPRLSAALPTLSGDLQSLLPAQLQMGQEMVGHFASGFGSYEKVVAVGGMEKFSSRKTQPSPMSASEVYDIEAHIKGLLQRGFFFVGGLGGISMENGHRAGELIIMPGGITCVRCEVDRGKHVTMLVPPHSVYPLAVFTGRKVSRPGQASFIALLSKGESINAPLEKIASLVKDPKKTITGSIIGSFSAQSGYIFRKAIPKTELIEFSEKEKRTLFIYQTRMGEGIPGFTSMIHSHGYEAAKSGARDSFGAHLYDAVVDELAVGIFSVAKEMVPVR